jgi:PhnB protein
MAGAEDTSRPAPDADGGRAIVTTQLMPQLSVRRGREAIDFYVRAFGAVELYRVGGTSEEESVVAQLSIGGAPFWVSDESPPHRNFSPEFLGGGSVRLLLVVDDPDAAIRRAVEAGAREVNPPANDHGWRIGRVTDPFGHDWEIGQPFGAWPPRGGLEGDAEQSEQSEQTEQSEPAEATERAATVAEVAAVLAAVQDVLPRGVTLSAADMDEYVEAFRALKDQGDSSTEPDSSP